MIVASHKTRPSHSWPGPVVGAMLGACLAILADARLEAAAPPEPYDSVILEEDLSIEIHSLDRARVRYRNRTHVLTGRGVEALDGVSLWYNPSVTFWKLGGTVQLPSGKVNKKGVTTAYDGTAFSSYELYSDMRQKVLTFTGLVPGAIVEYGYEKEVTNLFYLRDELLLQEAVPARAKTLTVTVAREVPVRFDVVGSGPEHRVEEGPEAVTHRWRVTDAPAFKREPGSPPGDDLLPRISVVPEVIRWGGLRIESSTWDGIARFYHDLAEDRMRPGPQVAEQARAVAGAASDDREKAKLVYEFVQGRVNYVAIELGIGGYQPHDSAAVLHHKYGDCKDKATLTIAMLRALGVQALPVLILTRDAGLLSRDRPSPGFNHAIVALPSAGAYLFLDPTSTAARFGDLPWGDQGASALVVKPDGTGDFLITPLAPPEKNRRHLDLRARVGTTGDLTGTLTIRESGQRLAWLLDRLREEHDEEAEVIGDLVAATLPGAQVRRHAIEPSAGPDGAPRVTVEFAIPGFLTRAGTLEFIRQNPERIESIAALGRKVDRTQPLFVPFLSEEVVTSRIELPPGRTLKRVPEDVELTGPGASARCRVRLEQGQAGDVVQVERSVIVATREVPVVEWPAFRSFLAAVAEQESRSLTLVPSPSLERGLREAEDSLLRAAFAP